MSAEYSVEEVRAVADAIEFRGGAFSPVAVAMLRAYAERIKADEGAVPRRFADTKLWMDIEDTLQHARFFITTREKMNPTGVELYDLLIKRCLAARADALEAFTHPPAQAAQVDDRLSDELRSFIEGMSVSVDVSTGDADAGHRYFGTVTEVMDCADDKHGVTLLVQDAEPNFKAEKPVSSAAIEALRDVDHVVTQWRESGREPAYAQWLTLQDVVRAALAAAPSPGESE